MEAYMLPIINRDKPIMAVRTRLKALREERNLTRMDIVRRADISYLTVSKWEKEPLKEIDSVVLMKLCNFLGITIDDLIVEITEDNGDPE